MNPKNHDLEAITVRRAKVADGNTVRYRVYSAPSEFVVVVADSALMAIKVSGISKPYKIMRDLLTDGIAIEVKKIEPASSHHEKIILPTVNTQKEELIAELPESSVAAEEVFVPLGIAELRNQSGPRVRILSPDMVTEIIEQHAKHQVPPKEEPLVPEPVIAPLPVHEEPPEVPQFSAAPPEPSIEEKMTQLAQEVLPSIKDLDPEFHPKPAERKELSKEEVEKLLNG